MAAAHYDLISERVEVLARAHAGVLATTPVPACPGWSAHDVVSHLAGIAADVTSGRLRGQPDDEWTAGQVAARRDIPIESVLAEWAAQRPALLDHIRAKARWRPVIDVLSHYHDLCGALGEPGDRDDAAMHDVTDLMATGLDLPVPVEIGTGRRSFRGGPDGGEPLVWRTTDFEFFRVRLGRRSRAQILAMDWSGDPSPVIGALCAFGPAVADVVE